MAHKEFSTADADAFSNFVQGRALFQDYLGTGSGEELNQARSHFATATARDPEFDIARLYLAVTQTELRDPDAAISALQQLIRKKRYLPEAHVQLAYAHIKRYTNDDYAEAENELNRALEASRSAKRGDLIDLVEAYHVFLFAVRAGFGKYDPKQKKAYLDNALSLGEELLKRQRTDDARKEWVAAQFEVNNAMGVAYLFRGELFHSDPDSANWWLQSEKYLNTALELRPRSVRVLQNLGLLHTVQGNQAQAQGDTNKAQQHYELAKGLVERSLKLNPFDQYPHFQMALLAIKTGDWATAQGFLESGTKQKGAVALDKWTTVRESIKSQDPSKIHGLR